MIIDDDCGVFVLLFVCSFVINTQHYIQTKGLYCVLCAVILDSSFALLLCVRAHGAGAGWRCMIRAVWFRWRRRGLRVPEGYYSSDENNRRPWMHLDNQTLPNNL